MYKSKLIWRFSAIAAQLALVSLLSGCALFAEKPVAPVYITKVTVPDDALLVDCEIEPPPPKEDYMKADMSGREGLLAKHAGKQMKNLFKCNDRLGQLRSWKKEVKAQETQTK